MAVEVLSPRAAAYAFSLHSKYLKNTEYLVKLQYLLCSESGALSMFAPGRGGNDASARVAGCEVIVSIV